MKSKNVTQRGKSILGWTHLEHHPFTLFINLLNFLKSQEIIKWSFSLQIFLLHLLGCIEF